MLDAAARPGFAVALASTVNVRVSARPDLTSFCRLDQLGLVVTGQHLGPDQAVVACRVLEDGDDCHEPA